MPRGAKWKLTVCLVLVAAHFSSSFAICSFVYWLYFDAGVKWTPDPVVPQIQGVLAFAGESLMSLIFVPAAMLAHGHARHALAIAVGLPLASASIPFLLPNIFGWLIGLILLAVMGTAMLRKPARAQ